MSVTKATRRILVVNIEGNLLSNPSLISLISFLAESNYTVDVLSPHFRGPLEDAANLGVHKIILRPRLIHRALKWNPWLVVFAPLFRIILRPWLRNSWDLIIGIDRDGVILAYLLSLFSGSPYSLISYEIFFASETSVSFKKPEIIACRDVVFAICQDDERSKHLALENKLPLSKIINIPVSPRGTSDYIYSGNLLKAHLSVTHRHVAIVTGSLDDWTMIEELLISTAQWPQEWCLVVHPRYNIGTTRLEKLNRLAGSNVYFSTKYLGDIDRTYSILCQADLGIAFYRPTYRDQWVGRNIEDLGLSSGKIAMYLRGGLPVLMNDIGGYPPLLNDYKAGFVVAHPEDIGALLKANSDKILSMRSNAKLLFSQRLSSDLFRTPFLEVVKKSIGT